jgi:hypothetical protein
MSDATTIATIKTQTLAIIAEITTTPKPSYNIDGQSISWGEYLRQLQDTVEWCDKQITAEEPFEVVSQGYCP